MWPWEHAIVGYLAYSLFCHCWYRRSPSGLAAFAVVFASVLPDMIDKPLAWEFGVFQTGYALGHSVFFVVPFAIVVGCCARWVGRLPAGLAFGIGYLLHLPGDLFHNYARGGRVYLEILLWPVERVATQDYGQGFLGEFVRLFGRYQQDFLAGELSTYMWLQLGLATAAALVWLYDGAPVLREPLVAARRLVVGPSRGSNRDH